MEVKTDRELLELAAKAAGIELVWDGVGLQSPRKKADWNYWNPLTDDGDALRLAVKLHINLEHLRTLKTMVFDEISAAPFGRGDALSVERVDGDSCAATRRAIVRAAAELARKGAK